MAGLKLLNRVATKYLGCQIKKINSLLEPLRDYPSAIQMFEYKLFSFLSPTFSVRALNMEKYYKVYYTC